MATSQGSSGISPRVGAREALGADAPPRGAGTRDGTLKTLRLRAAAALRRIRPHRREPPRARPSPPRPAAAVRRALGEARARLAAAWGRRTGASSSTPTCAAAVRRALRGLGRRCGRKGGAAEENDDLRGADQESAQWSEWSGVRWEGGAAPRPFVPDLRLLPPGEGPVFVPLSSTTFSSCTSASSPPPSACSADRAGRVPAVRPGVYEWVEAIAGECDWAPVPEADITVCHEDPEDLPEREEMRVDPSDPQGWSYTQAEFIAFYGGRAEWDAIGAAPAPLPLADAVSNCSETTTEPEASHGSIAEQDKEVPKGSLTERRASGGMKTIVELLSNDAVSRRVAQWAPLELGQLSCTASVARIVVFEWYSCWSDTLGFCFAMQCTQHDELVAELPLPALAMADLNCFGRVLQRAIREDGPDRELQLALLGKVRSALRFFIFCRETFKDLTAQRQPMHDSMGQWLGHVSRALERVAAPNAESGSGC